MKLSNTIGGAALEVHFQEETTGKPFDPEIPSTTVQFFALMKMAYHYGKGAAFHRLFDSFVAEVLGYLSHHQEKTLAMSQEYQDDGQGMSWEEMKELEELMDEHHKKKKG